MGLVHTEIGKPEGASSHGFLRGTFAPQACDGERPAVTASLRGAVVGAERFFLTTAGRRADGIRGRLCRPRRHLRCRNARCRVHRSAIFFDRSLYVSMRRKKPNETPNMRAGERMGSRPGFLRSMRTSWIQAICEGDATPLAAGPFLPSDVPDHPLGPSSPSSLSSVATPELAARGAASGPPGCACCRLPPLRRCC